MPKHAYAYTFNYSEFFGTRLPYPGRFSSIFDKQQRIIANNNRHSNKNMLWTIYRLTKLNWAHTCLDSNSTIDIRIYTPGHWAGTTSYQFVDSKHLRTFSFGIQFSSVRNWVNGYNHHQNTFTVHIWACPGRVSVEPNFFLNFFVRNAIDPRIDLILESFYGIYLFNFHKCD